MRLIGLFALLIILMMPAFGQSDGTPPRTAEIAYGPHPRQRLDFTPAAGREAPLVLFVHGGGWRRGDKRMAAHMAAYVRGRGFAFAAANYRLVPDATVAQQAGDVAAALARVMREPGVDPRRILLIGHSAGAHLVALAGSDPAYLAAHRIPLSAIGGVAALDGAGYDVPRQMAQSGQFLRRLYTNAFGDDPAAQHQVSPIAHAAAPNAQRFLILHIASRPDDSGAQSQALGTALRRAGTQAEVAAVEGTHAQIFREWGTPGHRATALTDAFAQEVFGSIERR
ncbi:alpha/beta hydrolase [Sphingosinicella sp. LHD-64]|uniref:alpha/beta hydrolase n=1 Tax=Sphingosinicella sp. LHD-64 TaxID=3072139 RepID=UPI00280D232E|nr:alpha/beta hydrolase [Sphingosinicella sp. LHD-64]MDQ8756188.1 alpha/beta hydrolase [Sphingosinicella sp. LHD-64]